MSATVHRVLAPLPLVLLCVAVPPAAAQEEARAVRARGERPVIDGRLDDPAWRQAPPLTGLRQRNPVEGAAPSESTEVRFLYTDRELFIGYRAFDSQPHRISGRLVRRDQRTAADNFNIFLDSYHDRRTAFEIQLNPSGSRRDVFIYDDGQGRDESWDPVYDWATATDSLGWTAELRIPFSQLRFRRQDSLTFGLRVRRFLLRRNEEDNWPFFPRDQAGEVSRYGRLVGLADLPTPRRVELLPYTAGSLALEPAQPGNPFLDGSRSVVRGGADLKLGLTSSLTMDLTANPDFGQVEADPSVVNLTAFESFFPERRPFFVEGVNLFRFPIGPVGRAAGEFGGMGGGTAEGLVYTRRIGRTPQVSPSVPGGFADPAGPATILGAAKMSGQLGGGWSVGLLQAVTAREHAATLDSSGVRGRAPVEPLTSYSVARAERNAARGRLTYGVLGTGMVRRLDSPIFDTLRRHAVSGGASVRARLGRDRYEIEAAAMGSRVDGSRAAMLITQRSSAHYFQRPDQAYAPLDSTRTSLSGFAGNARVAKVVGLLTWDARFVTRSPGFEINDVGFLPRADLHEERLDVKLRWLTPGRVFRRFELELEQRGEFSYAWERNAATLEPQFEAEFLNNWGINGGLQRRFSTTATRLLRGGPAVLVPGGWEGQARVRTDMRRPIWGDLGFTRTAEDESGAGRWNVSGGVRWRPPGPLSLNLNARSSWGIDDRQFITRRTIRDSVYYLFGRVDRREMSLTVRADLVLTPRLSLELYAQPFVSAGRYGPLRLVADPRAATYAGRFDDLGADRLTRPGGGADLGVDVDRDGKRDFTIREPDFRIASLRTNAVLRWEFRAGSTLFLVWQQDRSRRISNGTLDVGNALGDAFGAPGTYVFAAKMAYWIGL